ncbi:MAG: hypothetical protein ACI80W_001756 [Porticoccaceae bacterium]
MFETQKTGISMSSIYSQCRVHWLNFSALKQLYSSTLLFGRAIL